MKVITTKSINLRYGEPHRRAQIKGVLYSGFRLDVDPRDGENIDGNNKWYEDRNGDYIWSGGVEIIPETLIADNETINAVHWGIKEMGIDQIWRKNIHGENVNIAVLDSGINREHPDLKEAILQTIDKSNSNNVNDKTGHGSHIAGIIAARKRLSDFQGIAPSCGLFIVKIRHDNSGSISINTAVDGIDWAITNTDAKIINLSLMFYAFSAELENKIKEANERGIIVLAAANGLSDGSISYPASLDTCISVGAAELSENRMILNVDSEPIINNTDIIAPGTGVWSTGHKGNFYRIDNGTSMATAFVSGVVALMIQRLKQKNITYNPGKIKEILYSTARDINNADGKTYPGKLIDPNAIITQIDQLPRLIT